MPSPLAAVSTADLLPSVLNVQQLRTFLSPFLRFTASIICVLLLRWESISTVYTVTFVIFKRTRLSHYPMSIHRLTQMRTSRMWHYGNKYSLLGMLYLSHSNLVVTLLQNYFLGIYNLHQRIFLPF